ncbi:hypothetical protein [Thioclava sp. GXIMD4215]|uniref:hypothetical protein n=1 Tax=Thioclava sp. GXIMD4215 TaxID=3131928 RepID=UPI00324FF565
MVETVSQADVSFNDQLWVGRLVGEVRTWTLILGVEEIGMPEKVPDSLDVTHQQSPGRSKEEKPGLLPSVDFSQSLQFWPEHASQILLDELYALTEAGTPEDVQVAFVVGGMQRTYRGYINGFTPSGTVGDKRMVSLGVKIFDRILPNPALPEAEE